MMRKVFALLLCVAMPLPAIAHTHVIAELGTAPLVGRVASTAELQTDVKRQRAIFASAGRGLGLTASQFAQFEERIANRQLTYVTIPRHLDAMSWRSAGRVHVLHDVVVPAGTKGWEVDLLDGGQILALFVPNRCGNLSLLRRPAPVLARAPAPAPAVHAAPPPQVAATQDLLGPAPAPATPAPYASAAMSTGTAPAHRFRAWPLLLLVPLIALMSSHGGHSGPVNVTPLSPLPPPAAPAPPPAGCPTPAPH